jgi:hypothetical protein
VGDVAVFEAVLWRENRGWYLSVDDVVRLHGHDPVALRHEMRDVLALIFEVEPETIVVTVTKLHT